MRTQRSVSRILFLMALGASGVQKADAEFYFHGWENHRLDRPSLTLIPSASYYSTSTNYDSAGKASIPSGFVGETRLGFDVFAAGQPFEGLTLYGRFSLARMSLNHSLYNSGASGLGDQMIGANFRLVTFGSGISLDLQSQFEFPLYSNSTSNTDGTPFMGDGTTDFTGGAFLRVPLIADSQKRLLINGGSGLTYRSGGFSSHIPWSAGVQMEKIGKGFRAGLDFFGVISLKGDTTNNPGYSVPLNGSGGSWLVNAINPSLLDLRGTVGYRWDPSMEIAAQFQQTLWGQNVAKGTALVLGFSYTVGGEPEHKKNRERDREKPEPEGFVSYGLEGKVTQINDRLNLLKIDRGKDDGVQNGMTFTIFSVKSDGTLVEAVARAKVKDVKTHEAVLNIESYFKEVWIEPGFIVKRPME